MADQIPFSPLTQHELNERHGQAARSAFYYLRACRSGDRLVLSDADQAALVEYITEADAALDAARLRLAVSR